MTSKNWDAHVTDAESIARGAGFRGLRDRIVELAEPQTGHVVVDVGSGTGLLSLAFAERTARVWAIDSSPAMNEYLRVKAASADLDNVRPCWPPPSAFPSSTESPISWFPTTACTSYAAPTSIALSPRPGVFSSRADGS